MSTLSDELSKSEYIGLSDQQAADAVNAKTVVVQQSVAIRDLKTYAIFQGIWPKLLAGEKSSNPQVAGLCQSVVAWVDDPRISTVDVNMPQVQAMLTQLVGATIITQQQASEIVAMGSKSIAWTTSVGLPEIGIGLVINARKEIANEVQI
jgi:hypothetical protein